MSEVVDGLLSIQGAAQFLGVRKGMIYKLLAAGDLVCSQIGRHKKIPRRALQRLAAKGLVKP